MTKDYRRLWKDVTYAINKGEAVRMLSTILVDKEGRASVSRLKRKDAELCIEILDYVRCDPRLARPPPHMVSSGYCKVQPHERREADFLGHAGGTCWTPWPPSGFHDDNEKYSS